MSVTLNPMATGNAPGLFSSSTEGLIQGFAYDDPASRFYLTQGVVGGSAPMIGGMACQNFIPLAGNPGVASATIQASTALTNFMGLTVFNQSHAMIETPNVAGGAVPVALTNMSLNFYRFGSNARIAVKCAPSLVSLDGGLISQQVSWDFFGHQLVPFQTAYAANVITAATFAANGGAPQATFTTTSALGLTAGQIFNTTGFTPAGWNGSYQVVSNSGTTLVGSFLSSTPTVTPGAPTTFGSVAAGGGAAPFRGIIEILSGNSMTINIDPTGTIFTWNQSGTAATVLL